jgi:hypothetical protein
MTERQAEFLEILVGQGRENVDVDIVGGKQIGILAEAMPSEPLADIVHKAPPRSS